jgi:molybdopterin/thiamine biosynthesis adenylyltransferase
MTDLAGRREDNMQRELVIPSLVLETGIGALMNEADGANAAAVGPLRRWLGTRRSVFAASSLHPHSEVANHAAGLPLAGTQVAGMLVVQWMFEASIADLDMQHWLQRFAMQRQTQAADWWPLPLLLLLVDGTGHLAANVDINGQVQHIDSIRLPGPSMLRPVLSSGSSRTTEASDDFTASRFSRLAGALGDATLSRLQRSKFALIGAGRVGSSIAATLVRHGASLLIVDPDVVEPHNANDSDALVPSLHEGMNKCDALVRALKPSLRPGATIEGRRLSVTSHVAAYAVSTCDMVISAVDNAPARFSAAVWAAASHLPHLDVGIGLPLAGGAGVDVRLILPPSGCLLCQGGITEQKQLLAGVIDPSSITPDFGTRRRGSTRSLSAIAANLGVRLIEQLFEGLIREHRFVQVHEDAKDGALKLLEGRPRIRRSCSLCDPLAGIGVGAIDSALIATVAARVSAEGVGR